MLITTKLLHKTSHFYIFNFVFESDCMRRFYRKPRLFQQTQSHSFNTYLVAQFMLELPQPRSFLQCKVS